ncbi:MAG: hydroxymethylbilane synthase [Synergistaceae bacterium]|jgi:hydroxymethylbilane synthase|nr:hydroxymethylbilane synthase [Synergistaceae bacterium]
MKKHDESKKILLMGGTTEGRELFDTGLPFVYSTATEYGAVLVEGGDDEGTVISGRMDGPRMIELLKTGEFAGVIDATHPYASEVKLNIQRACETAGVPLFRILRPATSFGPEDDVIVTNSWEEAASYLERTAGNALLTIGSKELHNFVNIPDFKTRLYARILPFPESEAICAKLGFSPSNIIAEFGPFSESANLSHLERTRAGILVTKDGGQEGGVPEKLSAARKHGAKVLMIARPSPRDQGSDISSGSAADALSWAVSLPGVGRGTFGRSSRVRTAGHTRIIRVGSRESILAVAQAKSVMESISRSHPEFDLELVTMKTKGDRFSALFPASGMSAGGQIVKGMFVKELESALLDGSIDLAVHSLKDMSLVENPDLPIVAYTEREDPRDVIITRAAAGEASPLARALDGLIHRSAGLSSVDLSGFVAGCSSPRRRVQLRRAAGCKTSPVRGNVITRLERLDSGEWDFDFLVLAAAGLIRLGMRDRIDYYFPADEIIPAAGQGVLACQGRAGEDYGYLSSVNDPIASARAASERAFASATGGGCSSPVAAYAEEDGGEIILIGLYADEESGIYSRGRMRGPIERAGELGERLAVKIMSSIDDGGCKDE